MLKLIIANADRHLNGTTRLKVDLQHYLGPEWRVEGLPTALPVPREAFNPVLRRYDAEMLLDYYDRLAAERGFFSDMPGKMIVLLPYDLTYSKKPYTFGLSYLGGRDSVVSYARFKEDETGAHRLQHPKFEERIFKECVHELGHAMGIQKCLVRNCIMHCARRVVEIDGKGFLPCESCARKFAMYDEFQRELTSELSLKMTKMREAKVNYDREQAAIDRFLTPAKAPTVPPVTIPPRMMGRPQPARAPQRHHAPAAPNPRAVTARRTTVTRLTATHLPKSVKEVKHYTPGKIRVLSEPPQAPKPKKPGSRK